MNSINKISSTILANGMSASNNLTWFIKSKAVCDHFLDLFTSDLNYNSS
jgi:hypothetical protein